MITYLIGAALFFGFWAVRFMFDDESDKTDRFLWMLILIAALIWPLSVFIACIEIVMKVKKGNGANNLAVTEVMK